MNQEYLWSKQGSDSEVEKLEDLLREFRFDEKSVVELPAMSFVPVASAPKRRFILALSFAGSAAAAAAILVGIWIMTPRNVPLASEEPNAPSSQESARSKNDDPVERGLSRPATSVAPTANAHFINTRLNLHRSKVHPVPSVIKTAKENLTKEEKYAYDRLMFALSIAGSKLRVVQDTIDRKGDAGPQSIRNEK